MRLRILVSVSAICILPPISLLADAIVEGQVNLPKSHAPPPVMAKRYEIVTNGGVLATRPPLAVVYLDGSFPTPTSHPTKQVAQKDLAFLPPLLPVQVGTTVEFPNLDNTYHNIFSYSPTTLRCDIHEHMRGLILVLNTPYFVITDEGGRFRLSGLPSGHYTLKAWIDS